jgi:hypothetical protein
MGQETVNREVENFPFRVVRDNLDWDKVYELVWAGAGSGLGARGVLLKWWARVRGCTGLHSAFVFFSSFSAVRAALSVPYRSFNILGGDLIYMVCM